VSVNFQEPLLSLLYDMEQAKILQLLDYQVEWFEERGYSEEIVCCIISNKITVRKLDKSFLLLKV
jgi:hypothetical protein